MNMQPVNYGPAAQPLTCPHCHAQITSKVEPQTTTKTHLIALLLCCLGCCLCAWIPYVSDSCKNMKHSCPSCNAYLGEYKN